VCDAVKIKTMGEVFASTAPVEEMLKNSSCPIFGSCKDFLDPSCGNGQF
jgi:hypothetical protein